jgi:hypothetical protein
VPLQRLRLPRTGSRASADARARVRAVDTEVTSPAEARGVPAATVARLPLYLQALHALADQGIVTVSSQELAELVHVSAAMLRKDLSQLGSYGTRGVGYDVATLVHEMSGVLGSSTTGRSRSSASATWAGRWPTTAASPAAA